jgi:GDPmannose 4,6-dehydratase
MAKKALITGITGQTGSYLAEILLKEGYEVHGMIRRGSTITTERINHLFPPFPKLGGTTLHFGDLADANSIVSLLMKLKPDEVYNLGSMSHVRVSFNIPEYTGQVTGLAPTRILEALRSLGMINVKYYQASSSEMFGISPPPQNEETPFRPQSPYGAAKLYAYWMTKVYRTGYNMFACNGILFNHESPRRGETFVTKKIVRGAVRIKLGLTDKIYLGNLEAKRDWGFAGDYAEAIYKIMQHDKPDDFVIATEEFYSIKEFADRVFNKLGLELSDHIETVDKYFRPNEVPELKGDATKAKKILGWEPKVKFDQLINMMVEEVMKEEKAKMEQK